MKTLPALLSLLCLLAPWAHAFPPAPYYALFGTVRDQVGQTVNAEGATLILLRGGVEIGRTPIQAAPSRDSNCELRGCLKNHLRRGF